MKFRLEESLFDEVTCEPAQDDAQGVITDDGIFVYEVREPNCVPDTFNDEANARECALQKKLDCMYKVGYTIKDGTYVPTGYVQEIRLQVPVKEGRMKDLDIDIQNAGGKDAWLASAKKTLSQTREYRDYLDKYARREVNAGGNFDSVEELEDAIKCQDDIIKNLSAKISLVEN